jgi:hypothetical protein
LVVRIFGLVRPALFVFGGGLHKILAVVLKHGPLAPTPVPGFHGTPPQGMAAVVPGLIVKIAEMSAYGATDQPLRDRSEIRITAVLHGIPLYCSGFKGSEV